MNSRILPTIALFAAVGIFFGYVNPAWSGTIADAKAAIALDNQTLAAAEEYARKQDALATARASIDPTNLARLSTFLPDSVDNVGLILDLNALAARSGLALSNVDVITVDSGANKGASNTTAPGTSPLGDQNPIGSVNLSLSAAGTYSSLQSFLSGIERSARLLDIQDLVVRGSDTGIYAYQMILRLYWLR
jgi:Tfp pilus assembly protein PilO